MLNRPTFGGHINFLVGLLLVEDIKKIKFKACEALKT